MESDREREKEAQVYQLQAGLCGQRYAGSSISNIRTDEETNKRILGWLKHRKNFLVLMGRPGSGKTYICSALIPWMFEKNPDLYFMREGRLIERLKKCFQNDWDWRAELTNLTDHWFFILDDIGSSRETDFQKDVISEFVFNRYESGLPTVFCTNLNEKQIIEIFGERTHSRLFAKENTIIDMFSYPDMRIS